MLVYFLCRQNAGRSQMAQAFFERAAPEIDSRSGGSAPADRIHPEVIAVMREAGFDLSDRRPQGIDREALQRADVLVSMGCDDPAVCDYPGRPLEDWQIPDPAGKSLDDVRAIRDQIRSRVEELAGRLRARVR